MTKKFYEIKKGRNYIFQEIADRRKLITNGEFLGSIG